MGQETSCKPASSADYRRSHDMPASGVKAVGRVGESDGNAESDAPGRNRHELGLNRLGRRHISRPVRRFHPKTICSYLVSKTCDDGRRIECERSLENHVRNLAHGEIG